MKQHLDRMGNRGQAEMVGVAVTLIISVAVGVIVVGQLFASGAGPSQSDNENQPGYGTASAVTAYNNVQTLSWAGIGLLAIAIIVMAASVILGIVRGGLTGGRAGGV